MLLWEDSEEEGRVVEGGVQSFPLPSWCKAASFLAKTKGAGQASVAFNFVLAGHARRVHGLHLELELHQAS